MNTYKNATTVEILRQRGFSETEIQHLQAFRRYYFKYGRDLDQLPLDPRRLQFVCWLVAHGKLSEDLPVVMEEEPDALKGA